MSRVTRLREALAEAVGALAAGGPRERHRANRLLPDGIPFWAGGPLATTLRAHGFTPQRWRAGRALGVITDGPHGAELVWVEVVEVDHAWDGAPAPPTVSAATADALYRAATVAIGLYPHHASIDARRQLQFTLRALDGANLELPADQRVTGSSLGLAALIATWSLLSDRPVDEPLVFTGILAQPTIFCRTAVLEPRALDLKSAEVVAATARLVLGVESADPELSLRRLLRGREDARGVTDVAGALAVAFGPDWSGSHNRIPPRFDALVALDVLDIAYRRNGEGLLWSELGDRFAALVERGVLPHAMEALAMARAGACYNHANHLEAAAAMLGRARRRIEEVGPSQIDGEVEVTTLIHLANHARDEYDFARAEADARRALDLATSLRLHTDAAKATSTLGQILVATGRAAEGLIYVEAGLRFFEEQGSSECSRNHCYRVEALVRIGDLDAARAEHALGAAHNDRRADPQQRRRNRAFLDYALLGGELRALRRDERGAETLVARAQAASSGDPTGWPGVGIERIRRAALMRTPDASVDEIAEGAAQAAVGAAAAKRLLLAWHHALVLVDASVVKMVRGAEPSAVRPLVARACAQLPGPSARRWFRPFLDRWEELNSASLTDRLLGLLEAEPY